MACQGANLRRVYPAHVDLPAGGAYQVSVPLNELPLRLVHHCLEAATRARRYEARAFPYVNLGRLYEAKWQYRQALQNYKRALGEQPDYAVALQAVGRLQAMMN